MRCGWKAILCCLAYLVAASPAFGQNANTVTITGSGAPAGTCAFILRYINGLNGDFWSCNPATSTWIKIGPGGGGGGITQIDPGANVGPTVTFQVGTTGTDFNLSNPAANQIRYNLPTASALNRGALSTADWTTFNNKQPALSTHAAVAKNYLTGFTAPNTFTAAQPSCGDLSDAGTGCSGAAYPGLVAHDILSVTHADTTPSAAVLGGIIYADANPKWVQLAGNITSTRKYLGQTGTGVVSAAPSWTQVGWSELSGVPGTFPATAHDILSTTHGDTTPAAAFRGDMIAAIGASPKWERVAHSATSGGYWKWNGTDVVASTLAAAGTGSCTNQAVTALSSDAAPTCTTLTSAYTSGTFPATAHDILSATHGDTTAAAVVRGDLMTGQGVSPKWARLAKGAASECLQMDGGGTDIVWGSCSAGGFPRLDQVLDPNADKTFDMGTNFIDFSWANYAVKHLATGSEFGNGSDFTWTFNPGVNIPIGVTLDAGFGYMTFGDQTYATFGKFTFAQTDEASETSATVNITDSENLDNAVPVALVVRSIANATTAPGGRVTGLQAQAENALESGQGGSQVTAIIAAPTATGTALAHEASIKGVTANLSGGFIDNAYGFYVPSPLAGIADNLYGLKVENLTAGTTNYAIKTGLGQVSFGDKTIGTRFSTANAGALVSGDFTIGANWGNTASIGSIRGTDQAFSATITSNGTGIAATPTLALTFHDGTWTTVPVFVCKESNSNDIITDVTYVVTATDLTLTFLGTPTSGKTYEFSCIGWGI